MNTMAEAEPAPAAKEEEPAKPAAPAPAAFGGGRILPYVLIWIAMTYGRDMLAGPQAVEQVQNAPSAARAPPVSHAAHDAADEEFADFPSAAAAPVEVKQVKAVDVPVMPRGAATDVLVRLCTS